MYKEENRPLKEVMRIMETEHQFLATPKMYKKRIKDWAIDKNLKSDNGLNAHRTKQQRYSTQDSHFGVREPLADAQEISNYVRYSPDIAHRFQDGSLPSAEETMQREYSTPLTMLPTEQPNDDQYWASAGRFHEVTSFSSPLHAQSGQFGERDRASVLLYSIRHRFLEASDAMMRRDTARLFDILNPAYEAISEVAEAEAEQLLSVVAHLFELLHERPNHQDMLRQLLHYVFALIPDAVRQSQLLSRNSQVLALLGQSGYDSLFGVPLDLAGTTDSNAAAPRHGCYEQPSEARPAFDTRFGGNYTYGY
ncbi:hypothetical protein J7T55_007179 [Diaporthe amygdali]|uniref:uncharacterized protein n=1 Tax=Phomopsis amygdali TaxID=1214568 RepID=UPI0022FE6CCB|nr:uncharacterized protein J7T55_007179 [Diaporthe amygdali]KAJ0108060.1 hypothetical protein J7T55_007179 [Diaporthe amygdali]